MRDWPFTEYSSTNRPPALFLGSAISVMKTCTPCAPPSRKTHLRRSLALWLPTLIHAT